jgi:hypothetical protein
MNKTAKKPAKAKTEKEKRAKLQARRGFLLLYNRWLAMGKPSL